MSDEIKDDMHGRIESFDQSVRSLERRLRAVERRLSIEVPPEDATGDLRSWRTKNYKVKNQFSHRSEN